MKYPNQLILGGFKNTTQYAILIKLTKLTAENHGRVAVSKCKQQLHFGFFSANLDLEIKDLVLLNTKIKLAWVEVTVKLLKERIVYIWCQIDLSDSLG